MRLHTGIFGVNHHSGPDGAAGSQAPQADPYATWSRIAAGLRRGDGGAFEEFAATYGNGARLLFRRRVGSVRAERMLGEALAGAANEVRLGWVTSPRDLVFFFRDLCGQPCADPAAPLDSPAELVRARVPAARLEEILARLSEAERHAVRLYYVNGISLKDALARAGLDSGDAERLRRRLRLAFAPPEDAAREAESSRSLRFRWLRAAAQSR